jgi:hypothetical protein
MPPANKSIPQLVSCFTQLLATAAALLLYSLGAASAAETGGQGHHTTCAAPHTGLCTACDSCCHDLSQAACAACTADRCDGSNHCDPAAVGGCNVCQGCCDEYVGADKSSCDSCVNHTCAGIVAVLDCANHGTVSHPADCTWGCITGCYTKLSSPCLQNCVDNPGALFAVALPVLGRLLVDFVLAHFIFRKLAIKARAQACVCRVWRRAVCCVERKPYETEWQQLNEEQQLAVKQLGWTDKTWSAGPWLSCGLEAADKAGHPRLKGREWTKLTHEEQMSARRLGLGEQHFGQAPLEIANKLRGWCCGGKTRARYEMVERGDAAVQHDAEGDRLTDDVESSSQEPEPEPAPKLARQRSGGASSDRLTMQLLTGVRECKHVLYSRYNLCGVSRKLHHQSSCGQWLRGAARLLFWHTLQPILYFVVFAICSSDLDRLQFTLGAMVGGREGLYLLCTILCVLCNPAFLVVDVQASIADEKATSIAPEWEYGPSFLALYVLAPEKFVAFALFGKQGFNVRWLGNLIVVVSIILDLCAVGALGAGLGSDVLPLPLAIGYIVSALGGLGFTGIFVAHMLTAAIRHAIHLRDHTAAASAQVPDLLFKKAKQRLGRTFKKDAPTLITHLNALDHTRKKELSDAGGMEIVDGKKFELTKEMCQFEELAAATRQSSLGAGVIEGASGIFNENAAAGASDVLGKKPAYEVTEISMEGGRPIPQAATCNSKGDYYLQVGREQEMVYLYHRKEGVPREEAAFSHSVLYGQTSPKLRDLDDYIYEVDAGFAVFLGSEKKYSNLYRTDPASASAIVYQAKLGYSQWASLLDSNVTDGGGTTDASCEPDAPCRACSYIASFAATVVAGGLAAAIEMGHGMTAIAIVVSASALAGLVGWLLLRRRRMHAKR